MGSEAQTRSAARRGTAAFPRWAIEAGLRPLDADGLTFAGTLATSGARFSATRANGVTTLRAAALAAAGLQYPVWVWWDPVYGELACGARRIEDSDIACAFMSGALREALSAPMLAAGAAEHEGVAGVAWFAGQVVVQWPGPVDDPDRLAALIAALDAAVVAVRAAQLDQLIDIDFQADLPCPGYRSEDEAPADGALAAVFVAVAALAGGLVLAAGAGVAGALVVAALVVAIGVAVTVQKGVLVRGGSAREELDLLADLYAGYHGLQREDPAAFQQRFWALGAACAPVGMLRGTVPGTALWGRILWGAGPGDCSAAAVIVPVPDGMVELVADRVEHVDGASMAGGCLLVLAVDASPVGLDLIDEVTLRAAALLAS